MKTVVVRYRKEEDGAWIATTSDAPGFYAYGDSLPEAQSRVQEGLPSFADVPDMLIAHVTGDSPAVGGTRNPQVKLGITRQSQPAPRYNHQLAGVSLPCR